jgi:hypothetical protein
MKRYSFDIGDWEISNFFSAIREKRDVILLLMKTVKLINSPLSPIEPNRKAGEIILLISKMSRLFFVSDVKIFSIRFPFFVGESEEQFTISSVYVENIDSKLTSHIISFFSFSEAFEFPDFLDFAEYLPDEDERIWNLVRELLLFEDGYIRFDHDPRNANDKIHPLNHFDVFYTDQCSFKIGIHQKISVSEIIDFLDRGTECSYLEQWKN